MIGDVRRGPFFTISASDNENLHFASPLARFYQYQSAAKNYQINPNASKVTAIFAS